MATLALAMLLVGAPPALAQEDFGDAGLFPDLSLGGFGEIESDPYQWSARYQHDGPGQAVLEVEVDLSPTWHVYSVTQKPGGPTKTKISISSPAGVKLAAPFQPNKPPHSSVSATFKGVTVEEHEGKVVWTAPIKIPKSFDGDITLAIDALVCKTDGSCIPVIEKLTATMASSGQGTPQASDVASSDSTASPAAKPFRDGDYVVEWSATVSPSVLSPGKRGQLKFTAKPDSGYHVYKSAIDDAESSTNFVVTKKQGFKVGAPVTNAKVITKTILPSLPQVHYHHGAVTWALPIEVPADLAAGEYSIEGMIGYQACTDSSCHRPVALKFVADVTVGPEGDASTVTAVKFASAKSADAMDAAATSKWADKLETAADAVPVADPPASSDETAKTTVDQTDKSEAAAVPIDVEPPSDSKSFGGILIFAFIGGVILNFMPCVLPVVGLKVMSFVKQAGEDRGRILKLNVVYVFGILSIFAVLALLAVFLNFSWGQQFTFFEVKLGLTLLLFALALSYLGVWEIPAPSFAASKKSQELEGREGYAGAFAKGAFATVLATPCSGPLLGYIFGTTFGLSTPQTIAVIMMVGIGMSLPYLIIGIRPSLVSWLPKPGAWMETLKEFLAFLFLGTVAFFFHGFSDDHKLPVFVSLIGVWFGCWVIGKVPNWETLNKRLSAWGFGVAAAAAISIAAFQLLVPGESTLQWEDYSETRLVALQDEGRTVMVDFTADWCVNCLVNYEVAIDTEPTRELLEELDAVPMIADWSDRSNTAIPAKLKELRSRSIPVLAIYPGSRPDEPIILRDLVSQTAVLSALRQAGASVPQGAAKESNAIASAAPLHP